MKSLIAFIARKRSEAAAYAKAREIAAEFPGHLVPVRYRGEVIGSVYVAPAEDGWGHV